MRLGRCVEWDRNLGWQPCNSLKALPRWASMAPSTPQPSRSNSESLFSLDCLKWSFISRMEFVSDAKMSWCRCWKRHATYVWQNVLQGEWSSEHRFLFFFLFFYFQWWISVSEEFTRVVMHGSAYTKIYLKYIAEKTEFTTLIKGYLFLLLFNNKEQCLEQLLCLL